MADDLTPDVEQDPAVVAAEAVEARAHVVVERVRADALARAKHAQDLARLQARIAAEEAAAAPPPAADPAPEPNAPSVSVPDIEPEPVAEPAPAAPEPVAQEPEPAQPPEDLAPQAEPKAAPVEAAPEAPAPEPAPEASPATEPVAEPEPAPPAPEPRSARAPFATGRTRPGPRVWRNGGAVQVSEHEWLRVRGELTDAEAADGEAGGERLRALAAARGAVAVWSVARPS